MNQPSPAFSLEHALQTALQASRLAGGPLLRGSSAWRHVNAEAGRDVKLQADIESEALLREHIAKSPFPFPIIGEEEGGDPALPSGNQPYWVIDPLDGTYNYLRRQPLTCISIGLMRGMEPLLGVIHDFNRDETFAGIAPTGQFFFNGQPVKPEWADSLQRACLMTGFPSSRSLNAATLQDLAQVVAPFRKVRMIGSAALAVAWVALGRADCYQEEGTRLWDIAAGMALVLAAGGNIRIIPAGPEGAPFSCHAAAAGRPEWLDHILPK